MSHNRCIWNKFKVQTQVSFLCKQEGLSSGYSTSSLKSKGFSEPQSSSQIPRELRLRPCVQPGSHYWMLVREMQNRDQSCSGRFVFPTAAEQQSHSKTRSWWNRLLWLVIPRRQWKWTRLSVPKRYSFGVWSSLFQALAMQQMWWRWENTFPEPRSSLPPRASTPGHRAQKSP
jgi:hypothetical protein